MAPIGCTCDETLILEARHVDKTIEYTGRVYRVVPDQHNCQYVRVRNSLIPLAWLRAEERSRNEDERTAVFHAEMDRLVKLAYERGDV